MKNLNSENPCSKPLFRRGGGYDYAFTMAEILLSLTIIGVVAAITLPSLTGNINERTWNTQRKALYARMSQAISLMPALNGYGTLDDTTDTAAETFITAGLSKVLKINNICDSEHLKDCGLPDKIIRIDGASIINLADIKTLHNYNTLFKRAGGQGGNYSQKDTTAAAFETANGESILVYYNPYCVSKMDGKSATRADGLTFTYYYSQGRMCANFVYDLNGNKGPNTVGKDIGVITALYPSDSVVVAPNPFVKDNVGRAQSFSIALRACRELEADSRLPNLEEDMSLIYNKFLFNTNSGSAPYMSSTLNKDAKPMTVAADTGEVYEDYGVWPGVRCVKR